jgi:hypothetical protein
MRKVIAATRRAMSKIGLGWPKRNGRGNGEGEGEGEKEGEELPEATPTPTNAIDDADTEEGNAEKIESQAITPQVMESHSQQTKAKNLEVAYRRYVGMHVSYFGAASILSQFSEYFWQLSRALPARKTLKIERKNMKRLFGQSLTHPGFLRHTRKFGNFLMVVVARLRSFTTLWALCIARLNWPDC